MLIQITNHNDAIEVLLGVSKYVPDPTYTQAQLDSFQRKVKISETEYEVRQK